MAHKSQLSVCACGWREVGFLGFPNRDTDPNPRGFTQLAPHPDPLILMTPPSNMTTLDISDFYMHFEETPLFPSPLQSRLVGQALAPVFVSR